MYVFLLFFWYVDFSLYIIKLYMFKLVRLICKTMLNIIKNNILVFIIVYCNIGMNKIK